MSTSDRPSRSTTRSSPMAKSTTRSRRPQQRHHDEPEVQEQNAQPAATAVEAPPAESAPAPAPSRTNDDVASFDAETNAKYEQVKGGKLFIKDLQQMDVHQLHEIAKAEGIQDYVGLKKQDLIFQILRSRIRQNGLMYGEGVLEILPDGFGFLRSPEYNYLPCPDDIYISPSQIRRFGLRNGHVVQEIGRASCRERV